MKRRPSDMNRSVWFVVASALVLAACGEEDASAASATSSPSADQVYTGTFFVLENADHGPQLCTDGVMESYPVQCSGTDVVGWSWADVEGEESHAGTTHGTYRITGTYDGTAFTVTEPGVLAPDTAFDLPMPSVDFSTPCEPPAGGWSLPDPAKVTDEAISAAIAYATAEPDYGYLWMDKSIHPAGADNHVAKMVLNFTFTGDLERHEAELRKIWGGALCVSQAQRTQAELRAIEQDLIALPERATHSIDEVTGTLTLYVMVDDGPPGPIRREVRRGHRQRRRHPAACRRRWRQRGLMIDVRVDARTDRPRTLPWKRQRATSWRVTPAAVKAHSAQ